MWARDSSFLEPICIYSGSVKLTEQMLLSKNTWSFFFFKFIQYRSTKIAHGTILRVRIISNLGNNTDWIGKNCSGALSRFHEQFIVLMQWLQDSVGDVLHSIYGDKKAWISFMCDNNSQTSSDINNKLLLNKTHLILPS